MQIDRLFVNATLATLTENGGGIGLIEDGCLGCRGGSIAFVGRIESLPRDTVVAERVDCERRLITPGLIDCHTHLVHAGDRSGEFEKRLAGASYEDIAKAGGGIASTVAATRLASEQALLDESLPRVDALIAEGVTTVEIKSGYGLDLDNELKQLRVARAAAGVRKIDVRTSFLGAHALPPEMKGRKAEYVDALCDVMLPAVAKSGLADAVDGFCETIAFEPDEIARVFRRARELGLPVKLHAEQMSNLHGAALAASFGALSADHLEHIDEAGTVALAKAGTVGVMLPGAYYFLRDTKAPPIDLFRKHRLRLAVATDCNPGSSPLTSPLLAMNMAATLFRLTVSECIAGFTREAARALGCLADRGTLEVGKRCDLAIWDVERPAALVYRIGFNPLHRRIFGGQA